MVKTKELDKKILNLIQEENLCVPRITRIAHKLQVPTSTVQARIKKMEDEKVITGCTVLVNPDKINKGFTAFLLGQAKLGKDVKFDKPVENLKKIEQVQEIFFITGDYDYLVKIRVKNQEEYYQVAEKVVKCFEARGQGIIATRCFKDNPKLKVK